MPVAFELQLVLKLHRQQGQDCRVIPCGRGSRMVGVLQETHDPLAESRIHLVLPKEASELTQLLRLFRPTAMKSTHQGGHRADDTGGGDQRYEAHHVGIHPFGFAHRFNGRGTKAQLSQSPTDARIVLFKKAAVLITKDREPRSTIGASQTKPDTSNDMLHQDHGHHDQCETELDGSHFRFKLVLQKSRNATDLSQAQHPKESQKSQESRGRGGVAHVKAAKLQQQIGETDRDIDQKPGLQIVTGDRPAIRDQRSLLQIPGEEGEEDVETPINHREVRQDFPGRENGRHVHIYQLHRNAKGILDQDQDSNGIPKGPEIARGAEHDAVDFEPPIPRCVLLKNRSHRKRLRQISGERHATLPPGR
mmetsp:Transcript_58029/g.91792  ORF Transcript_58029/g.91792 Transcript_58029/m.91792 type:complete len:363 (-) Transcript_58029:498-1586(-)